MPPVEVVEFTDPACSWAWGTEPKLRLLQWRHGHRLAWRRVMGGLVPNRLEREPDFDPTARAARGAEYWAKVSAHTGQPWPVHLQRMPVSSIEACVAVKAAERQGEASAARLLRRLREACFVFGAPADTPERILATAGSVDGLDADRLATEMASPEVDAAYRAGWEETRAPNEYVRTLREDHAGAGNAKEQDGRWRYVFPTLLFRGPGGEHTVPGWQPWNAYVAAMEAAAPGSTADARPDPSVEEAFGEWGSLTGRELTFLCGEGAVPPEGVVAYDWGAGLAWFSPLEAAARGVPVTAA